MDTHDLALFLHLLGVVSMFSGIAVAALAQARARTRDDPAEVALTLGFARTGVLLAGPGVLLTLAAGGWLMSLDDLGFDTGWLATAVGLFLVSMLLGALGGRRPRLARELAERLAASGDSVTPDLRRLLDDRASLVLNIASALTMLAVLWLMVSKPS